VLLVLEDSSAFIGNQEAYLDRPNPYALSFSSAMRGFFSWKKTETHQALIGEVNTSVVFFKKTMATASEIQDQGQRKSYPSHLMTLAKYFT
jgi:hypothetical protein